MKSPEQSGETLSEAEKEKTERQRLELKIERALDLVKRFGSTDEAHHKAWVIDQMVRELTGCPIVPIEGVGAKGEKTTYGNLGESEQYQEFVREARKGEDGPETYDWDTGIAP